MECFSFKNCANLFDLKEAQLTLLTEPVGPVMFRPAATIYLSLAHRQLLPEAISSFNWQHPGKVHRIGFGLTRIY